MTNDLYPEVQPSGSSTSLLASIEPISFANKNGFSSMGLRNADRLGVHSAENIREDNGDKIIAGEAIP